MKNIFAISIFVLVVLAVACKEEPPYINYEVSKVSSETTYVDLANIPIKQPREVLIEDISGVKCVNCPDAAAVINGLKVDYPGRVNSITIYPNTAGLNALTSPINKPSEGYVSKYEMRTETGGQILATLGTPNSLPSGYVNRKLYPGNTYRFIDRTQWADIVNSEKDSLTPVNIGIVSSYAADGKLNAEITLKFTENLAGDYYLSVVLIQDSIIDVQEYNDPVVGTSYNAYYPHRHVLRKMFTSNLGDKINNANLILEKGRVSKKIYSLALINDVNAPPFPGFDKKHLGIIAFVVRESDGVILQSKEIEVPE